MHSMAPRAALTALVLSFATAATFVCPVSTGKTAILACYCRERPPRRQLRTVPIPSPRVIINS
jgi:hypothetical protein